MRQCMQFGLASIFTMAHLAAQVQPAAGAALFGGLIPPALASSSRPTSGRGGPGILASPFQAQEVFRSHPAIYGRGQRLEILVNQYLYPGVSAELLSYVELLEQEGWAVAVSVSSGGRDIDLKAFLQRRYRVDRIQGAFMIGDLPVAWFEMDDDFFMRHSAFPCDLYYMDLDGNWIDQDQDGLWDGHASSGSGDARPEIFLGRLTASPYADALKTEADWVRSYLAKAARWRGSRAGLPERALAFQDGPWAHLDTGQQHAFSQVNAVLGATGAARYMAELASSYHSVVLCASSDATGHTFAGSGGAPSRVQATEILGSPGNFLFCNLFAAYAGDFSEPRYIGGAYVLAGRGAICTLASTKVGAMTDWAGFYQALGQGASVGAAFKEWFGQGYPYGREYVRWHYGLTLLGDPTLAVRPQTLTPSLPSLPSSGGRIDLDLDCGLGEAWNRYLLLATASGTSPGIVLPGFRLPLNLDPITNAFLGALNTPLLQNAWGTLNSRGQAQVSLVWPRPLAPEIQGTQLHFTALLMDPGNLDFLGALPPAAVGLASEVRLSEEFLTPVMRDLYRSGVSWGGGKLKPGLVGGSGILGDFDPEVGSTVIGSGASKVYLFHTENTNIPGDRTLNGQPYRVLDGRFEFASFVVPPGVTVRFEGKYPARIHVRGRVEIHGTLDLSGETSTVPAIFNSTPNEPGAPGGKPGAGGGAGGAGGDEPPSGAPHGRAGEDVPMPPGHPRSAWRVGTGGPGSREHPPGLNTALIVLDYYNISSIQHAAPGGGGGSYTAGRIGSIVMVNPPNWSMKYPAPIPVHGAPVTPSNRIPYSPLLGAQQVIDQVLLGGGGGGGAGVSPWGAWSTAPGQVVLSLGNGGGGGGGAIALRSGGDLIVSPTGSILTTGGSGGGSKMGGLAPGGGGAGGTILLQSAGVSSVQGTLDLSGGPALNSMDLYSTSVLTSAPGGDGYFRFEAIPAPSLASLGSVKPSPTAENVGLLTDEDPVTGAQSLWYNTGVDRPLFTQYLIEGVANGQPVAYSDLSNPPGANQPVLAFYLQGARLDRQGTPIPGSKSAWFTRVADLMTAQATVDPSLKANAVRWVILLQPRLLPSPAALELNRISMFYAE